MLETHLKPLKHLLSLIQNGELVLPDFQRDFVWDPGAVEELIESIMSTYPSGSLLFLKHSGKGFRIREFQGSPPLKSQAGASSLVLDGQQRLTSLYQAFFGKGEHRFFLTVKELIESGDIESAVWHESTKKCQRNGYDQIAVQAERLICPLQVVMGEGYDNWVDSVMDLRPEQGELAKDLRSQLRQVSKDWIQKILDYHFPVVTLPEETPIDAVCKMFETLNRRGVKLTVFELLMARSFANDVSLRTLWETAKEENPILEQFDIDPYYVLQIISLLSGGTLRRSEILEIESVIVSQYWKAATESLSSSIEFLRRNCGVLTPSLLPYNTMLVPLASAWARTREIKGPQEAVRREKFEQWFWASVFSQAYENSPSSRAVSDFKDLNAWVQGNEKEPYGLRALHFNPSMFFEITPKQRALYRGVLALIASNNALDFHNAEKLTFDYLEKNKVDDHHIFPQNYLKSDVDQIKVNCILNRTLIDKKTNIRISDKAPSAYLAEMELEIGKGRLDAILASHLINTTHLRNDDFDNFTQDRAQSLLVFLKEKLRREIAPNPNMQVLDEEEIEEVDDAPDIRSKYDPSLINSNPDKLLDGLPIEIAELFTLFTNRLLEKRPDVWWKSNIRKVVFWSPEKVFLTLRMSKTGLHFVTFTNGDALENVAPIIQRDNGGALWGRLKLKTKADLEKVISAALESHTRLLAAASKGKSTSWWAMASKAQ